jgi:hypothetical protein
VTTTFVRLLILFALASGAASADAQETVTPPSCVYFDSDSSGVWYGTLTRLTFPGPPNYESIVGGDRPEQVIALVLPQDACWAFENHVFHAQLLQLTGEPKVLAAAAALIGQEVEVDAKTTLAASGHHHTPMMLDVSSIRPRTPSAKGN